MVSPWSGTHPPKPRGEPGSEGTAGSAPSAGHSLRKCAEEAGGDQEGHCHLLVTLPRAPGPRSWEEQDRHPHTSALSSAGAGCKSPGMPQGLEGFTITSCPAFSSPNRSGGDLAPAIPLPRVPSPLLAMPGCPIGAATASGLSLIQIHL